MTGLVTADCVRGSRDWTPYYYYYYYIFIFIQGHPYRPIGLLTGCPNQVHNWMRRSWSDVALRISGGAEFHLTAAKYDSECKPKLYDKNYNLGQTANFKVPYFRKIVYQSTIFSTPSWPGLRFEHGPLFFQPGQAAVTFKYPASPPPPPPHTHTKHDIAHFHDGTTI